MPVWPESSGDESFVSQEIPHNLEIEDHVVCLIPRSVARENLVLPLTESAEVLLVAAAVPVDRELIDKLQYIVDRRVLVVPTSSEWIRCQLDRHYPTDGV
jgi:type IV pilus assembly protein PilB